MSDHKPDNFRAKVEIASAFAVLLGLIFVGLELRQNTAAVEAATFQNLTDATNDYILELASNSDILRVWNIGSVNPDQLNELDALRYNLVMRAYWVRMQNVFSQWKRGTLAAQDWRLYQAVICDPDNVTGNIGERVTFDQHTIVLSPEFIEFVGACWNE